MYAINLKREGMNKSIYDGRGSSRIEFCVHRAKTVHQILRREILTNYETLCEEMRLR